MTLAICLLVSVVFCAMGAAAQGNPTSAVSDAAYCEYGSVPYPVHSWDVPGPTHTCDCVWQGDKAGWSNCTEHYKATCEYESKYWLEDQWAENAGSKVCHCQQGQWQQCTDYTYCDKTPYCYYDKVCEDKCYVEQHCVNQPVCKYVPECIVKNVCQPVKKCEDEKVCELVKKPVKSKVCDKKCTECPKGPLGRRLSSHGKECEPVCKVVCEDVIKHVEEEVCKLVPKCIVAEECHPKKECVDKKVCENVKQCEPKKVCKKECKDVQKCHDVWTCSYDSYSSDTTNTGWSG